MRSHSLRTQPMHLKAWRMCAFRPAKDWRVYKWLFCVGIGLQSHPAVSVVTVSTYVPVLLAVIPV